MADQEKDSGPRYLTGEEVLKLITWGSAQIEQERKRLRPLLERMRNSQGEERQALAAEYMAGVVIVCARTSARVIKRMEVLSLPRSSEDPANPAAGPSL